jgi:hypothetical protein
VSADKYRAIVVDQQQKIDRLVQARGVAPVRKVYRQIMGELVTAVAQAPPGFDRVVKEGMLAQARTAMVRFVDHGGKAAAGGSAAAQATAAAESFKLLATMERTFKGAVTPMPVDEIAIIRKLTDRAPSLLGVHKRSLSRYGARLIGKFQEQTSLGLALGESTPQIVERIQTTGDLEWWQAERIVRTETAYAYNAAQRDAITAQAEELDDPLLCAQWSEQADEDGAPLDDRVAVDSLAMHGQVAPTGGVFTMPPTSPRPDAKGRTKVPDALVGKTWDCPPNRPNDRSALTPWRPDWDLPGWVWRSGRRVDAARALGRRGRAA